MEDATKKGRPVKELPIEFEWHEGAWEEIFDKQTALIQQDVLRALAADKLVVYLSCPISARGGSIASTNVEVAHATARRLTSEWGERFWFLDPAQYQLESRQGSGLIKQQANTIEISGKAVDLDKLKTDQPPTGGDYLRMWTRVLAEDGGQNLGERFSAFYFIGPTDFRHFFTEGGRTSLSTGVETYFARQYTVDAEFNAYFSPPFKDGAGNPLDSATEWDRRRKEFLRYYTVRASGAFSRGSHDEWNIWVALNKLRMQRPDFALGTQIPGFFDGHQVDPAAAETTIAPGYAVPSLPISPARLPAHGRPTEATSGAHALDKLATRRIGATEKA